VGLSRGAPEPWQYVLGNALKVVGGAVGGMVLARQRQVQTNQALKTVYSKEATTE